MKANPKNLIPEETAFDYVPQFNFIPIINSDGDIELHSTLDENCIATLRLTNLEGFDEELADELKLEYGEETIYQLLMGNVQDNLN